MPHCAAPWTAWHRHGLVLRQAGFSLAQPSFLHVHGLVLKCCTDMPPHDHRKHFW